MITTILSDFSYVVLYPKDTKYKGTLNSLYKTLVANRKLFNFSDYYIFNEELLDYYQKLRKSYSINIFTTGSIQKNAIEVKERIKGVFDNVFTAQDLDLDKKEPKAYSYISRKLNKKPEEIIFIDDNPEFINAAKKAGMKTILFTMNNELINHLEKLGIST